MRPFLRAERRRGHRTLDRLRHEIAAQAVQAFGPLSRGHVQGDHDDVCRLGPAEQVAGRGRCRGENVGRGTGGRGDDHRVEPVVSDGPPAVPRLDPVGCHRGADHAAGADDRIGRGGDQLGHTSARCGEDRAGRCGTGADAAPAARRQQEAPLARREVEQLRHLAEAEAVGVGRVDAADERVDEALLDLVAEPGAHELPDRVVVDGRPREERFERGAQPCPARTAARSGRAGPDARAPRAAGRRGSGATRRTTPRRAPVRARPARRRGRPRWRAASRPARGRGTRRRPRRSVEAGEAASCRSVRRAGRRTRTRSRRAVWRWRAPRPRRGRRSRRRPRRRGRSSAACDVDHPIGERGHHVGIVVDAGGAVEGEPGLRRHGRPPRCRGRRAPRGGRRRSRRRTRARRPYSPARRARRSPAGCRARATARGCGRRSARRSHQSRRGRRRSATASAVARSSSGYGSPAVEDALRAASGR